MLTRLARQAIATLAAGLLVVSCTHQEPPAPPEPTSPTTPPEAPEGAGPQDGGTLRVGLSTDPGSLDPRFLVDDAGELIVDALFDPLVRVDDTGRVVPAAARRWDIEEDGRVFRFHLRTATFHDGTPVTADDFVRSFRRIADGTAEPVSFLAYLLEAVEGAAEAREGVPLRGVEAVDESTLVVRLSEPDPGFLTTLSDPSLVPLPPAADEDIAAFGMQPIGNGPFAMAGPREPGAFVRLSGFEGHRDPPFLDEVVLTMYDDLRGLDRQWTELLAGQLHVADLAPARRDEALERFGRSADGYRGPGVLDGITTTIYVYGVDTTTPPYDDPRIRRALSMAIDREALAQDVMQGTRAAASSLVPPSIPGYLPGNCGYCRHDPRAAAALLEDVRADAREEADAEAEADSEDGRPADADEQEPTATPDTDGSTADTGEQPGADDERPGADEEEPSADDERPGADEEEPSADEAEPDADVLDRLTLVHTRGDTHTAIADRMATDIAAALDLEVDFQARDLESLIESVRDGEIPVFRLGWEVTTPDPGAYLRPLFHSSQVGLDNLTRYDEPDVDALLDEARTMEDRSARFAAFRAAERRILTDLPVIPLLWYRHSTVVVPDVQGLVYSPLGRMNLAEVWLRDNGA